MIYGSHGLFIFLTSRETAASRASRESSKPKRIAGGNALLHPGIAFLLFPPPLPPPHLSPGSAFQGRKFRYPADSATAVKRVRPWLIRQPEILLLKKRAVDRQSDSVATDRSLFCAKLSVSVDATRRMFGVNASAAGNGLLIRSLPVHPRNTQPSRGNVFFIEEGLQ